MTIEIPNFKFALREDLVNNKEFLPTRAEPTASGWDVRAAFENKESFTFHPFMKKMVPLGIRCFCPENWWFELKCRSSTFAKKSLHSLYGTVDFAYEGQLFFVCQYIPEKTTETLTVNFGEALGQIIPIKRKEMIVEEVSNDYFDKLCKLRGAIRGKNGFGSTG